MASVAKKKCKSLSLFSWFALVPLWNVLSTISDSKFPDHVIAVAFWDAIGRPRTVVAPMVIDMIFYCVCCALSCYEYFFLRATDFADQVNQSELAFRLLTRRYGADLCYTPMFHSRLMVEETKYRKKVLKVFFVLMVMQQPYHYPYCEPLPRKSTVVLPTNATFTTIV